ncbi:MAG: acyltransferase [Krumholzibacteria bacterium]|nr:acyltransferase [Candidatus Krumholzibacteria bacterium]
MMTILRRFWWDLKSREGRVDLAYALIREWPDSFGSPARVRLLRRHFAAVGPRLAILEGARFRNLQNIRLGDNVSIGTDCLLQAGGGLSIGDHTLLGPGCKIWTQNHVADDPDRPIAEQGATYAAVSIGRDCWIGADAFIMPGVALPDGCIVAAGSVVGIKNYPPFAILMGNPARVIGYRGGRRPAAAPGGDQAGAPEDPA